MNDLDNIKYRVNAVYALVLAMYFHMDFVGMVALAIVLQLLDRLVEYARRWKDEQ